MGGDKPLPSPGWQSHRTNKRSVSRNKSNLRPAKQKPDAVRPRTVVRRATDDNDDDELRGKCALGTRFNDSYVHGRLYYSRCHR